jgi:hypothetical protein
MMIRHAIMSAALMCVAGPVLAQTISESDAKQAATHVTQAFVDAYNAGKPADIGAIFAADGVWLTPGGALLTDHAAITAAVAARIRAGWTKEAINVIEARPEGHDVLSLISYELQGSGPNAGKQIGGYATIWLTPDGSNWHFKLLASNLKPVQDSAAPAAPK